MHPGGGFFSPTTHHPTRAIITTNYSQEKRSCLAAEILTITKDATHLTHVIHIVIIIHVIRAMRPSVLDRRAGRGVTLAAHKLAVCHKTIIDVRRIGGHTVADGTSARVRN